MTAWNHQAQRIQAYKTYDLTEARVHDIVVRSVDVGILPNHKLPELLHEWREPRHDEFAPRTAWSLFNGFTEALKGNLAGLPRKTERLHGLLDTEVGVGINQQGERELQRSRVWSFRGPGEKGSAPRSGRGLFSY